MPTTMSRKKEQGSARANPIRLRVAVADDEPEVRAAVAKMLESLGHEISCTAATGRELVDHCLTTTVDLVMTDIRMPDMDGLEAAAVIYEKVRTPIILLSGHCDKELIERAEENHVFAYLMKPITAMQLEPAIALAAPLRGIPLAGARGQRFAASSGRPQIDRTRQGPDHETSQPGRAGGFPTAAKARQQQKQKAHRDRRDGAHNGRGLSG